MTTADRRSFLEEFLARLNAHDVAGLRALHGLSDEEWAPIGRSLLAMFEAFPDYRYTPFTVLVDGDTVAHFGEVSATHAGEYPAGELAGIAGTGKALHWNEAHYFVLGEEGTIIDGGLVVDGVARLQQLGALGPPERAFPA